MGHDPSVAYMLCRMHGYREKDLCCSVLNCRSLRGLQDMVGVMNHRQLLFLFYTAAMPTAVYLGIRGLRIKVLRLKA